MQSMRKGKFLQEFSDFSCVCSWSETEPNTWQQAIPASLPFYVSYSLPS